MAHLTGEDRSQLLLLPDAVDDYVGPDNPVRFIDAFVDGLDLEAAGFQRVHPKGTGRPGYDPGDLLKLYLYGYLNRIRSSRRLELETHRNLEVIWLLRRLQPDFKTIADFRRDNRRAFRQVFRSFVKLCRELDLYGRELLAVDGTRIKAVNSRERNFTRANLKHRLKKVDERLERQIDVVADRGYFKMEDIEACEAAGVTPYVAKPRRSLAGFAGRFPKSAFRYDEATDTYVCPTGERLSPTFTSKVRNMPLTYYGNYRACRACTIRERCTTARSRAIVRFVNEAILDRMANRLARRPDVLRRRRESVEHPFGSIKQWMGQGAFLMRRLENVRGEFSLTALAYNMRRAINLVGVPTLVKAACP